MPLFAMHKMERDECTELEESLQRLCECLDGTPEERTSTPVTRYSSGNSNPPLIPSDRISADSAFLPATQLKPRPPPLRDPTAVSRAGEEFTDSKNPRMPSYNPLDDGVNGRSPPPSSNPSPQHRLGKPVLPRDFLNIPPPAHPPDDSPTLPNKPLPPQRQLPPLPRHPSSESFEEEPFYEEAKPPPPAPRPSKQFGSGSLKRRGQQGAFSPVACQNGYELSLSATGRDHFHPVFPPQTELHQSQDGDWVQFPMQILERNAETGSFYIPSGHTTMSRLSPPSQKMDMAAQNKHNYTLLPGTETTVPQPVMQMRPEMTGGILSPPPRSLPQSKSSKKLNSCSRCSWKAVSYGLAVILLFALAVICYLLFALLSDSPQSRTYCGGRNLIEGSSELMISPQRPLPESFALGDPVIADLPSGVLTYTYFALQQDSNVQFNISIPSNGKLVLYGRQTLPPTPSEHDFSEIILGKKLHSKAERVRRSTKSTQSILRTTVLVHYLLAGKWQLGFLNDGRDMEAVEFSASLVSAQGDECKYGCYGKGVCKDGKCYCFQGFTGAYCEESVCPILCSGNGVFSGGSCHCHQGWKGADCDTPSSICLIPDCSRNGVCGPQGTCLCDNGWAGEFCDVRACIIPDCSNHGVCHEGECFCRFGWKGQGCEIPFTLEGICPGESQCSSHGTWDHLQDRCECDNGWDGKECEQRLCNIDCGLHGSCVDNTCVCEPGWRGDQCSEKECSAACYEHGICTQDGTCQCKKGWNGDNCQLEGCINRCSKQGECRKFGKNWRCACSSDFSGKDCSIPLEMDCEDGIDNDNDGLTDCEDSECCTYGSCRKHPLCQTVPNPYTVLLGEQPPSSQASFYQKIKFLLEPKSVQQYADTTLLNASRVSVIRGQVKSSSMGGLIGVRVTDRDNPLLGFTLSRGGGMFDLVVNGGGSVTLQFMRRPFQPIYQTISTPWNRVIRIDDVIMYTREEEIPINPVFGKYSEECSSLQMGTNLEPKLFPSWLTTKFGGPHPNVESGVIMCDSKTAYESLLIPGTEELYLAYFSANAPGYESSLKLLLVPGPVPDGLRTISIEIRIEGNNFLRTLEASPNHTFTYGWDKRNVYKQKVYGLTTARVKVGYSFRGCTEKIWKAAEVKMNGYVSGKPDVGGWNLHNHHHYNILDGVLEKGDGSFLYLKEEAPVIDTVIGNGQQRPLSCPFCGGNAKSRSLYQPNALATGPDGSIFIGDHNLIRKISPDGSVSTILELSPSDTAHQYYLEVNPSTGSVYISLPLRRQVWRAEEIRPEEALEPRTNFEVAVGTGRLCVVGESCGDDGPAESARLTFPKGIAFDSEGSLFIVDERRIRVVSPAGQIQTLLGSETLGQATWRPLPCRVNFRPQEISLQWPTHLKMDLLNRHLLILDSDMVFKVESMDLIRIVVGAPPHCTTIQDENNRTITPSRLSDSTAIAVDSSGRILVSESDGKRIHRIKSFQRGRPPTLIAGRDSKCACHPKHCPCDSEDSELARDAHLFNPMALSVSPDGTIYVSDQGNLKIRAIRPSLPQWNALTRQYSIYAPDSDHIFHFNQFGQHTATTSLLSGLPLFNFTYHIDTAYGKLIEVTSGGMHKLSLIRKSSGAIQFSTSQGVSSNAQLSLSQPVMLEMFKRPDGASSSFEYDANTGLLVSRHDGESDSRFYSYDYEGHSDKVVTKTGNIFSLQEIPSASGTLQSINSTFGYFTMYQTSISQFEQLGTSQKQYMFLNGGRTIRVDFPEGWSLQWERSSHSLLLPHQTTLIKQKMKVPAIDRPKREELSSRMEWRYYLRRSALPGSRTKKIVQVGRKTRVNGVNVLTIEYDRDQKIDTVSTVNGDPLLRVFYAPTGKVKRWEPTSAGLAAADMEYDSFGKILSLKWESYNENFFYDENGRLIRKNSESPRKQNPETRFTYEEQRLQWPSTVRTPGGAQYQIGYDKQGNLDTILTPVGDQHRFQIYPEMGYMVTIRHVPGVSRPYIVSKTSEGKVLEFVTPNSHLRAQFLYNQDGTLRRILQSSQSLEFERDSRGLPVRTKIEDSLGNLDVITARQGPLPIQIQSSYTSSSKISVTVRFDIYYDEHLRPKSVQASLNEQETLESVQMQYNTKSGRLERLKNFSFQGTGARTRILGENFVLETITNPKNEIMHMKMIIGGRKVSDVAITYDSFGNFVGIVDSSADISIKFQYTKNGELHSLSNSGDIVWSLSYDQAGRLTKSDSAEVMYKDGQIVQMGNDTYLNGVAGEIIRRGLMDFQYDALGRLVRAQESGKINVGLTYDDLNRVVAREDFIKKTLTTFYYIHPKRPDLLTHYFESSTESLSSFYYDHNDRLFAIDRSDRRFFVLTRPDGTPVKIFSQDGSAITSFNFPGPFGAASEESQTPSIYIPVGFRGEFQEREAGFSVIGGRPLDSHSGRWMSVSLQSVLTPINPFKPWTADILTYHSPDPKNTRILNYNINEWLSMCGVEVESLVPLLDVPSPTADAPYPISVGSLSGLRSAESEFRTLLSETPTQLLQPGPYPSSKYPVPSGISPVYGDGVVLSTFGEQAVVNFIVNTEKFLQEAMVVLLNETRIIKLKEFGFLQSWADNSKTVFSRHILWKEKTDMLEADLGTLGVSKQRVSLTRKLNLTALPETDEGAAICINSPSAEVIVHYGGEFEKVLSHYKTKILEEYTDQLWAEERGRVLTNSSLAYGYQWDEAELQELKSRGRLAEWTTVPRWSEERESIMYHRTYKKEGSR